MPRKPGSNLKHAAWATTEPARRFRQRPIRRTSCVAARKARVPEPTLCDILEFEQTNVETAMLTGTITAFDTDGQFGVIDADDGHILLFNLDGTDAALRDRFRCGTRVEFTEKEDTPAPRATALSILDTDAT